MAETQVELEGTVATVSELNASLRTLVRTDGPSFDYVVGDVSNVFLSGTTLHFDLVEDGASLHCLLFNVGVEPPEHVKEETRLAVKGRLNFYEKQGSCSIFADEAIPVGESEIHTALEQRRRQLTAEGLFAAEHKQPLPRLPATIGIVSSAGSDAEEDVINGIHSRHPDVDLLLVDARVQGQDAVEQLCGAIAYLDEGTAVDLIVVTRGGGGDQDLHAFNSEGVVRMIATARTPVVTAIGHENDHPLVDEVADVRAMTPTEVGAAVIEEKSQLQEQVRTNRERLATAYQGRVRTLLKERRRALATAYAETVTEQADALEGALGEAYDQLARRELTALRGQLTRAHQGFEQRHRHEQETTELRAQRRRLLVATVVLALLLAALVLVVALTL